MWATPQGNSHHPLSPTWSLFFAQSTSTRRARIVWKYATPANASWKFLQYVMFIPCFLLKPSTPSRPASQSRNHPTPPHGWCLALSCCSYQRFLDARCGRCWSTMVHPMVTHGLPKPRDLGHVLHVTRPLGVYQPYVNDRKLKCKSTFWPTHTHTHIFKSIIFMNSYLNIKRYCKL